MLGLSGSAVPGSVAAPGRLTPYVRGQRTVRRHTLKTTVATVSALALVLFVFVHSAIPFHLALLTIAGFGSRSCGTVPLRENGDSVFECLVSAARNGQAARAAFQLQGIDSTVMAGLVSQHGAISRLDLDDPLPLTFELPRYKLALCGRPTYASSTAVGGVTVPVPRLSCNDAAAP